MAKKQLPLVVALQFLLALSLGCGSSNMMSPPPPVSKSEFLYAMTFDPQAKSSQLMTFKLDPTTGVLGSPSSIALLPTFGMGMVADPGSKFLYLSDPNPLIHAIDINSIDPKSGLLTSDGAFILDNGICPFCPPISGPGPLTMDSKGKFLYYGSNVIGSGISQVIGGMSVNSTTGSLSLVPGSPFAADDVPAAVLVHPSGHFLYTEDLALGPGLPLQGVSGFSIDSNTGALTPVTGSPFTAPTNADTTGFAIHPTGKFMYASSGTAANGVLAWSIDSTSGALTALAASPFAAGTTTFGVTISPSGKFLYSSNSLNGGISGFSIDAASGVLAPINGSPFDTSVRWGQCVVDPSGKLLIAVDGKSKAIALFSIDSTTGALTLDNSTPIGGIALSLALANAPQ
jgi:6-phosphogluconolactonase (cycloisomerase 2 family)